ncbi:hypothetical protein M440DRAFT_1178540 [Trichoderma longibrachiatum ATCC 18648]|uniref:Uncharacterized protein n=1 Tax=Trichoderma longibrachiatum ATCC 18648 TaxID=983965 RepID=A0A2T4CDW7_TRILO|nr:hypothetical protein M440DRAFT_1178540 [Trichoderma longibrachiatum ATCC 18648]
MERTLLYHAGAVGWKGSRDLGLRQQKGRANRAKGGRVGMAHQEGQCAFAMAREMVLDLIIPHRRKLYGLISPRYLFGHYLMNPLFRHAPLFSQLDELTAVGEWLEMEAASASSCVFEDVMLLTAHSPSMRAGTLGVFGTCRSYRTCCSPPWGSMAARMHIQEPRKLGIRRL